MSWQLVAVRVRADPVFVLLTRRVGNERRKIAKSTQETLADISSLVQESLSVSGILLGKTMGRTEELADRFDSESQLLADLEVRQRMAGRWMMASIQTTFAVMPAAVYWFGGLALAHGSHAITVPTLVAFTTLQTRLFFPVGSLLGVGLDVQTSLALFDRIFEYLDQPVDIDERDEPRELDHGRATSSFDDVWFRYGDDAWTLEDVSFTVPAGTKTALVGETGSGKTTLAYLAARLYDVGEGSVAIGGVDVRDLSFAALAHLVGVVSQETYLFHARCARTSASRSPTRPTRRSRPPRGGADPRPDRVAARGLRHGRRRARLPLLGRREAAHRDRAHDPAQPADPGARRGDELARHRDRAAGAGGARPARRRAGRRSRSRTGCRPSTTPTRSSSSTAGGSSSAGTHDELVAPAGATRRSSTAPPYCLSRLQRVEASLPVAERPRRPEWMKVRAPSQNGSYFDVKKLIHGARLHTICEEARCPNIAECWGRGTATFQILGETCTRACRYCYVHSGQAERARRPARAAAPRADRGADGPEARRRHVGRPRRRPRQGRGPLRGDDPRGARRSCRPRRSRC